RKVAQAMSGVLDSAFGNQLLGVPPAAHARQLKRLEAASTTAALAKLTRMRQRRDVRYSVQKQNQQVR
ncbi:MAG: hypothetical protein NTV22_01285, partial [bacterium]|nr:hypothetical protein [bacterium]